MPGKEEGIAPTKETTLLSKAQIDIKTLRLVNAAAEMLKFGEHEGPCDFGRLCPVCKNPQHPCPGHSDAMVRRKTELRAVLSEFGVEVPPS